ncbi:MAG TPA: T9SS type A sorting domain-containing protein, partial [Bacteroidales bacterium]|nr:T9SS type A sorting domain-containing protein [Bacteroidales bacterium]
GSITGIGELSQNGLNIYPNPNNGKFTLSVNHNGKINVKVVNSLGKVVLEQTYSGTQNNYNLNLQNQPKGYYLMTVTTDKNCISKTIIIQ